MKIFNIHVFIMTRYQEVGKLIFFSLTAQTQKMSTCWSNVPIDDTNWQIHGNVSMWASRYQFLGSTLIERFMGPTWGPPGGPTLARINLAIWVFIIHALSLTDRGVTHLDITDNNLYYQRFDHKIMKFSPLYSSPANIQRHRYILYKI